jgi:hypothetical protein
MKMPLFIGRVVVVTTETFEIPVSAVNEQGAIEYLNSTNEWKEELFSGIRPEAILVDGAKQVTTPTQTPKEWESNDACWARQDDQTVAEAFLDEKFRQIMPKEDAYDEAGFKEWQDYVEKKNMLCAEFDNARKIKGE